MPNSFFQKYNSSPYRELFIGYASIVGLIISIVTLIAAIHYSNWDIKFIEVTLILTLLAVSLMLSNLYITKQYHEIYKKHQESLPHMKKLEKKISDLELKLESGLEGQGKISQTLHNFCHSYREIIIKIHLANEKAELANLKAKLTNEKVERDGGQFKKLEGAFHGFQFSMIENIRAVMNVLTGNECAVCIKIYDENGEVRTLFRDAISSRERSEADKILSRYNYKQNSAFDHILDSFSKSFYINNDLKSDSHYKNANTEWEKFYNACLVTPIRFILNKDEEGFEISGLIGFICIDNKKGNFDDIICKDVLACYSDLCFYLYYLFNHYSETQGADNN